ncbi:MAG: VWA domain-containing protein [Chloroflexi bacterium]|nr:MAG: VWA domain-containing protein [Chloroflexota bacterium]
MSELLNYYAILGVSPKASPEEIRDAFANLLTNFPESGELSDNPAYRQILQAYEVLSDPTRRATYDELMAEAFGPRVSLSLQASREELAISENPQILYVLLNLSAKLPGSTSHRPLNLCLVIDHSTSMQGKRLDCVKSAVDLILDRLTPEDVISVVGFSDRAEVIISAGHVKDRPSLMSRVNSIRASGGTEIFQGLYAGYQQLRQVSLGQHINHLILLTDGHTYGDDEQCLELAQRMAREDIGISAFGIGTDWNDQFLDQLVMPSGGQSAFIEEPTRVIELLQQKISGLGMVLAQNARLMLDWPEGVKIRYGIKFFPFAQPLQTESREILLGDVEARGPLSVLLEVEVGPQTQQARLTLPFKVMARLPQQGTERPFETQLSLFVVPEPKPLHPPSDLVRAVRMLNMYRLNEKVWQEVEAGEVGTAVTRLRHLTTRLLEAGATQLAQQAYAETERLASLGELSPEGRKRLKYGTRSLIGKTLKLEDDDTV